MTGLSEKFYREESPEVYGGWRHDLHDKQHLRARVLGPFNQDSQCVNVTNNIWDVRFGGIATVTILHPVEIRRKGPVKVCIRKWIRRSVKSHKYT